MNRTIGKALLGLLVTTIAPLAAVAAPVQLAATPPAQPTWVTDDEKSRWTAAGLTIVASGAADERFRGKANEQDMAEESALLTARIKALEEIYGSAASSVSVGADRLAQAQTAVSATAGRVRVRVKNAWFDPESHRYHVRVIIPKDVAEKLVEQVIQVRVAVSDDGTFSAQR